MKEIKKVLICGIGAIGSILADKISKFDNENLRILVDKNRLETYIKTPKIFNDSELKLNYITPDNTDFKADLILIATKFNALDEVIKNLKNFVDENTIIMSILNGISSEEIIAKKYGWKNIPLTFFLGHSETIAPNQYYYDGRGTVVFGMKEKYTNPDIINTLDKYFTKTNINHKIPNDMNYSYWLKFMLNVSTNQPSAILRLTFGEMTSNPEFMSMFNNIMKEVQSIANAEGVKNTDKMIEDALTALKNLMPEGKTSMLQDVEAKRKTEVEMLAGTIIELGKKHNISTPYNTVMYEMIKSIETNY
ncbi:ketopantoate reductase family protein [bacterium]|nr:ketopantoate reductase family protein [bacterium]